MTLKQKQHNYYFGLFAELVASWYLKLHLYKIINHRFKSPFGEIDIVAKRNNQLVFIEIKARKDTSLMDFISKRQQLRINKAAEYFLKIHPKYKACEIRFDAIIVNKYFWPKHFKNYW